jgi:threonine synthase
MDPHTATCIKAYRTLRDEPLPTLICSTAEWTKFSPAVAKAIGIDAKGDQEALSHVSKALEAPVPPMIRSLFDKTIAHKTVIEKAAIKEEMLAFL